MRVYAEITVFALIALGVHAAGFAVSPDKGAQSAGDEGAFLMSLQASTVQMEQLVEDWTTEPDVSQDTTVLSEVAPSVEEPTLFEPAQMILPEPTRVPSVQPTELTTPSLMSEIAVPQAATEPAQKPQVDRELATTPKIRPKTRPKTIERVQKTKDASKPNKVEKPKPKAPKKQTVSKPKKAKPARAAQRKQKAAGQGGQTSAGSVGKAKVKSGSAKSAAKAMDVWGAQIRRNIERRKKSVRGLKRRARVTVAVTVAANGQVLSYRLSKSSGNKKADTAALRAVNAAGRMPKAVKGVAVRKHTFRIPMIFNP